MTKNETIGCVAEIDWGRSENQTFEFLATPGGVRSLCRRLMRKTSTVGAEIYFPAFWSYGEGAKSASTSSRGTTRRQVAAKYAESMAKSAVRDAIDDIESDDLDPSEYDAMIERVISDWSGN